MAITEQNVEGAVVAGRVMDERGGRLIVIGGPPHFLVAGVGRGAVVRVWFSQALAVKVDLVVEGQIRAEAVARKGSMDAVIVVHGQTNLLKVVGTLKTVGRAPHFLNGWEQQSNQDADDGDHD